MLLELRVTIPISTSAGLIIVSQMPPYSVSRKSLTYYETSFRLQGVCSRVFRTLIVYYSSAGVALRLVKISTSDSATGVSELLKVWSEASFLSAKVTCALYI